MTGVQTCALPILGFVLGRLMEEKFRQAMIMSRGSFSTFLDNWIAAVLIVLAIGLVVLAVIPAVSRGREQAFQE